MANAKLANLIHFIMVSLLSFVPERDAILIRRATRQDVSYPMPRFETARGHLSYAGFTPGSHEIALGLAHDKLVLCIGRGVQTVNWGFLLLRIAIGFGILILLFLSQRFWFRSLWRISANWCNACLRVTARALYVIALVLVILPTADGFRLGHGRIIQLRSRISVLPGL